MNEVTETGADVKWFIIFGVLAALVSVGTAAVFHLVKRPATIPATVAASVSASHPPSHPHRLAAFSLVERSGRTVTDADLRGRCAVVSFVFTACGIESRMVTRRMATIQERLAGRDDTRLVSLTIDPRTDTPEVLTRFAEKYGADANRWLFLTGEKAAVFQVIRDIFLSPDEWEAAKPGQPSSDAAQHALLVNRIFVLDAQGVVRANLNGLDETVPGEVVLALDKIRAAAKRP